MPKKFEPPKGAQFVLFEGHDLFYGINRALKPFGLRIRYKGNSAEWGDQVYVWAEPREKSNGKEKAKGQRKPRAQAKGFKDAL